MFYFIKWLIQFHANKSLYIFIGTGTVLNYIEIDQLKNKSSCFDKNPTYYNQTIVYDTGWKKLMQTIIICFKLFKYLSLIFTQKRKKKCYSYYSNKKIYYNNKIGLLQGR